MIDEHEGAFTLEKSVSQFTCVFVAIIEIVIAFLALRLIILEHTFIFFAISVLNVTVARFNTIYEIALEKVAITIFMSCMTSELVVGPGSLENVSQRRDKSSGTLSKIIDEGA